ncbi:hypothetical protein PILCRDRAFT_9739 [Piloderma croceum F 1598]|uniref:Uncharacterized protein n=1 Tax=Piloderma croceum (strain F 1598) TaxID=765440 RepID=A0A0C3BS95_PILCF|nr:hypothetical protein PILCRDRAFT_9739 [Piloderma croceum F 1598]
MYLPSIEGKLTHQVFPLDIQRDAPYLIVAWNKGRDQASLSVAVYDKYDEIFEIDFLTEGFSGKEIPSMPNSAPPDTSTGIVWMLPRGSYYVVVTAMIHKPTPAKLNPTVDATYVATPPSNFKLPDIPIAPGVITSPQVPAESCVFLPNRRFAPINLEDGKPQFRLTQMKGTRELFGINVEYAGGH